MQLCRNVIEIPTMTCSNREFSDPEIQTMLTIKRYISIIT